MSVPMLKKRLFVISLMFAQAAFAGSETSTVDEENFEVSEEILAIVGDAEYGEYLAGDCKGCHQADGSYDGIPSITGWDSESFVWAMQSYKQKARKHPVMQMLAERLSDEEIAALAAYFELLE